MGDHVQPSIDTSLNSHENAFSSFVQYLDVYVNKRCKEAINIVKRKELLKRGYFIDNSSNAETIFKGRTPPISRIELSIPRIVPVSSEVLSCMKLRKLLRKQLDQVLEAVLEFFSMCNVDITELRDEIFEEYLHFTLSLQNHVGLPELSSKSLLPFYIYSLCRTKYCVRHLLSYLLHERDKFTHFFYELNNDTNKLKLLQNGIVELSENLKQTLEDIDRYGLDDNTFTPKPDCIVGNVHSFLSLQQAELQEVLSKRFGIIKTCKLKSCHTPLDRTSNIHDEKQTVIYQDPIPPTLHSRPISAAKFSSGVCFPQERLQSVSAHSIYNDNLGLFQKLNNVYLKTFEIKRSANCNSVLN